MSELGPELNALLHSHLLKGQREPDGLLHASGDIIGSLRHTMLRMAGAPQKPDSIASLIRLNTGTMWHTELNGMIDDSWMQGFPEHISHEVSVNEGLPDGWGGTADTLLPSDGGTHYLLDYKTMKGEGLQYVLRDGAKPEHIAQVSAYYHALVAMGCDLEGCGVWYIPMNEDYKVSDGVQPVLVPVTPLPKDALFEDMKRRRLMVDMYLSSLNQAGTPAPNRQPSYYLTDPLAPVQSREQKLFKKGDQWDVSLVPHWSSMFCPYDDELCNCQMGGSTKIGHYKGGSYWPRKGYEQTLPTIRPKEYA